MADLTTLLNFEGNLENHFLTYLSNNISTPAVQFATPLNTAELEVPRLEIEIQANGAMDNLQYVLNAGGDKQEYLDYNVDLIIGIVTDNNTNTQAQHRSIRNQVRALLTRNGSFNTGLNYYAIRYLRNSQTSYDVSGEFNISTLVYTIVLSIKPEEWPA